MSLSKDLAKVHESATKMFGGYSDTHYQEGDSDTVIALKKKVNIKKCDWIDQQTKKLVTETMMALVNVANGQGNDVLADAMVDGLHKTHREIQRMFIQEHLIPALAKYADANDIKFTDGRNEGIKKVVGEMIEPFRYLIR
jgi:hypothetical protein